MLQASFQAALGQEELFSKIIEFFPYPIEVFSREGTAVMVNHAMLTEFEIPSRDVIVGKYNIFKDPEVEKSGLLELVKEVFRGKTVSVSDIKVPLKSIRECYRIEKFDIDSMYQDITGFPITDEAGKVTYVVVLLITRRIYKGKVSIIHAMEYLESNWDKAYDIDEAAKAANLSPSHFFRLFRNDVGMTPYQYYLKCKMKKLMEKLQDTNLTIAEAFNACGLDYSGHFAGMFKKHAGVTPSRYRKMTMMK